ncbi:hypothetical protein [Bacillus thuringiensis]|uniref:hypothetical protein n=1 Tax=Bacillus thuringiensis TaxID=1428 RepID=UPI0011A122F6|nr:hypothetical protein [Bacillus thuringiensis]
MFHKDDPEVVLMKYTIFLVIGIVALNIIIWGVLLVKHLVINNLTVVMYGITGIVFIGAGISMYFIKKEYDRITKYDFDRVKHLLSQYLKEHYFTGQNDSFVLVEEEKGVTRKEFLKRCFASYHIDLKVFVPDGELLCTVKVYKEGIRVKNVERLSHTNYKIELAK